MKTSEILFNARELVAARHCTEFYATDANGEAAFWRSIDACAFCTEGAIMRVLSDTFGYVTPYAAKEHRTCANYIERASIKNVDCNIIYRHDHNTHLENVECLERAILLAIEDEKCNIILNTNT